jgi:hypothetical protein
MPPAADLLLLCASIATLVMSQLAVAQQPCANLVPPNRAPGVPCGGPLVGSCSANGTCLCRTEYTGADCSTCHADYQYTVEYTKWGASGERCSHTPSLNDMDGVVATPSAQHVAPPSKGVSGSTDLWIGLITGGAITCLLLLSLIVFQVRRLRWQAAKYIEPVCGDADTSSVVHINPLAAEWEAQRTLQQDVSSLTSSEEDGVCKSSHKKLVQGDRVQTFVGEPSPGITRPPL